MKFFLIVSLMFTSLTVQAQTTRSKCENAHYATGYVKLHQYTVTVNWEKVSDANLSKLENILFDNFLILSTTEFTGRTSYKIKESNITDATSYELLLEDLKSVPADVSCTYDL